MKPVLLQNLMKKNRKESIKNDPSKEEVEKVANKTFGWILVALTVIIILSISVGA